MKRLLIIIGILGVLVALLLIAVRAYPVLIACAAGALVFGHRELWSLLRRRRLPVLDERVRANLNRAMRNGLLFFGITALLLMLLLSLGMVDGADPLTMVGVWFITVMAVYLGSYFYFEHAAPNLKDRETRFVSRALVMMGVALAVAVISLLLHNAIYALFGLDEAVFFILCIIVAPLAFVAAALTVLVFFVRGLVVKGA